MTPYDVVRRHPRSQQSRWGATLLGALVLLLVSVSVAAATVGPFIGLTLEQALVRLAEDGLEFVFTDRVVEPGMRVEAEPTTDEPRAILDQLLAPHGLEAKPGPGGVLMVVAAGLPTAVIEGIVRDRNDGHFLGQVEIRLDGEVRATTQADGEFRLAGLEAGLHRLEFGRPGYVVARRQMRLTDGEVRRLTLDLRPVPMSGERIDVTAHPLGVLGEQISALSLGPSELTALPRLADDPLRPLTLLPGTTGNDVSARFSVRGGHSDEVLVLFDGLEILEPYHLKDLNSALSILAPAAIGEVELLTGGFPAEYGDRMSGVLDLTSRQPELQMRTELGLSALQFQAANSGTLEEGRGNWLAAARVGSLKLAARLAQDERDPGFGDVFAKLATDLRDSRTLRLNALVSRDRLDFQELVVDADADGDEEADDAESRLESFQTSYENDYLWLTYQSVVSSDVELSARASYTRVERDRRGLDTDSDGEFTLADLRDLGVGAAAVDGRYRLGDRHYLKWGVEIRDLDADYDYRNDRQLEDPLAAIRDREREGLTLFDRRFRGRQYAAYFADRLEVASATFEIGVRYDENSILDDEYLSPRLSVIHDITSRSRLRLAWGLFYQSQRLYELPVEDGETRFFESEQAEHRIFGFEHVFEAGAGSLWRPLTLRTEFYERRIRDPRPRYENLFDPLSLVPELEPDRVRLAPQSALARGVEVLVSGGTERADWFASYAWASIEDRIEGVDIPRAVDQTHTIKLDVNLRVSQHWDLNLAWESRTGWPTTAVSARLLEEDEEEIAVELGPLRGERLTDYHRLDLRAGRWWSVGRGRLELYLQIQNVLGRDNVRGFDIDFEIEDGEVDVMRDEKHWLGTVPNIGLRWQF